MNRETTDGELVVSTRFAQWIGWVSLVLFGLGSVLATLDAEPVAGIGLFVFCLIGLLTILSYGAIHADDSGIAMVTPVGRFEMRWEEMERVELGKSNMVFHGNGKRLMLARPSLWNGPDKGDMIRMIMAKLEERNMKPKYAPRADFMLSKGTKVPRGE